MVVSTMVYAIITYDVDVSRVNKVKKFLRLYLQWVQNSVLEGELTKAELLEVKVGIKDMVEEDVDSIFIYTTKDKKYLNKEIIGIEKAPTEQII